MSVNIVSRLLARDGLTSDGEVMALPTHDAVEAFETEGRFRVEGRFFIGYSDVSIA